MDPNRNYQGNKVPKEVLPLHRSMGGEDGVCNSVFATLGQRANAVIKGNFEPLARPAKLSADISCRIEGLNSLGKALSHYQEIFPGNSFSSEPWGLSSRVELWGLASL